MNPDSPMAERQPQFKRRQYEFAAHIREPGINPCPKDVEDRRMAIYRELFYTNIESFVARSFPVLRKFYSHTDWHCMVRDFFAHHRSRTPYFMEISQEFLAYLQNERTPQPEDPPFVAELAHYEWVELALAISEEEPDWANIDPAGDLLEGRPALSPLAWLLCYQYPVHRISPEFIPQTPGEQLTYLMVYRDRQDKVGFMELNPVTTRLITLIQPQSNTTGLDLLVKIAEELRHPNPEIVIQGGKQTLLQLQTANIVLGTYK